MLGVGWEAIFDASESTGDHLRYSIEFGDGLFASEELLRHAPAVPPPDNVTVAKVTVTDRFGRTDSAAQALSVLQLATDGRSFAAGYYSEFSNGRFRFLTQEGSYVAGSYRDGDWKESPFSGRLSGGNEIKLTLDDGTIEWTGTYSVDRRDDFQRIFRLAVKGGAADGHTVLFRYRDPD